MKRKRLTRELVEAGYQAEKKGLPCEAPGNMWESQRAAWEMGWRAARHERNAKERLERHGYQLP